MAMMVCVDQLAFDLQLQVNHCLTDSAALVVPRESSRRKENDLQSQKCALRIKITLESGEIGETNYA